jgi:hypothetical protein
MFDRTTGKASAATPMQATIDALIAQPATSRNQARGTAARWTQPARAPRRCLIEIRGSLDHESRRLDDTGHYQALDALIIHHEKTPAAICHRAVPPDAPLGSQLAAPAEFQGSVDTT